MREGDDFLEQLLLGEEYGAYLDEEGNTARLELMGLLNRRQILEEMRSELTDELKLLQRRQHEALRDGTSVKQRADWNERQARIDNLQQRCDMLAPGVQDVEERVANAKARVIAALAAMLRRAIESSTRTLHRKKRECHENLAGCDVTATLEEFTALAEARAHLVTLYERLRPYHHLPPIEVAEIDLFSPLPELRHWGASYELSLEMARAKARTREI